ncbi:hypothetical protein [Pacificibacter marinus]|uniref:Uncharacterized protein n=1 Tax=Pacificibacter marinus TaxID=658057 RepID=A0A1Y5SZW5_9RHOB|nr:hypothetical protein [Pacificibacter marinus]SEL03112.1 hypothetical protein SAMN04488032_11037 [Pacificibacter marinus]SLN52173.1 hypothetical protein PAM7971_02621 [Pacificibacter marinus]
MTGYLLFKHAVQRVFQNLDEALAISGLIWIGTMAIIVVASTYAPTLPLTPEAWAEVPSMYKWIFFGSNVVVLLAGIWIAVEWHRFVLLGERPKTIIPPFRVQLFADYLGKSILITFLLCALTLGAMLAILIILMITGPVTLLIFAGALFCFTFMLYVFYRLSPVLPAAALGDRLTFRSAWTMTASYKTPIFRAAILMIFATMLAQIPTAFLGNGPISLVFSLVVGWAGLMVGVSLLSSIYELAVSGDDG